MQGISRRFLRLWLLAALAAALTAPAAQGAFVLGSTLSEGPNAGICEVSGEVALDRPCTLRQSGLAYGRVSPAGLTTPVEGVITRWSVLVGSPTPATASLKLQPRTFAGPQAKRAGAVVDVPLPGSGTYSYLSFPEQLPIISGQGFGLTAFLSNREEGAAAVPLLSEAPERGVVSYWEGPVSQAEEGFYETRYDSELLMQASVEPDADHDGLGDETQDPCVYPVVLSCPPEDRIAPTTATSFESRQGFLKTGRMVVRVRSNEAGSVAAEGLLAIHGATAWTYRLRRASVKIARPQSVSLVLRVPKKGLKAARSAAAKGRAVTARVTVTAADRSGNDATSSVVIKPSRTRAGR